MSTELTNNAEWVFDFLSYKFYIRDFLKNRISKVRKFSKILNALNVWFLFEEGLREEQI